MFRSLSRRAADAVGVHTLIARFRQKTGTPVILLGDFNDTAKAVTTGIARYIRGMDTGYIDHIFVSDEFTELAGFSAGRVTDILYRMPDDADRPDRSDHPFVMTTIALS